jgi:hypothetical protein
MFLIINKMEYPATARLDVANIVLDMFYVLTASFVNIIIGPADYAS